MARVALTVLMVMACAVAVWSLSRDLLPPQSVRFAAGSEGGGYWRISERYARILARDDITLDLVATAGSVENARLLEEGAVDAALLQGGIATEGSETLGAVFIEPLLVFVGDGGDVPRNPARWDGLIIAAGGEGSGTRAAVMAFLRGAGVTSGANTLLPEGGADAAAALMEGRADVAIFVAPLSAPYLAPLLDGERTQLLQLDHVTSLSRRVPQSQLVDVPSGAFSLDPPLPPRDLRLLGMVARIASRPDLHPSAVDRLVEAAREVHGPGDAITAEGTFPTMENTTLPQDAYARDLIADGPSSLSGILPFWVIAQINRFAILLLPIVFLLLPLLRLIPGLYRWRIRSRVFRHYARIHEIDDEISSAEDADKLTKLDEELSSLDAQIAGVYLPLPYRDYAYQARLHIDLLRKKIADRLA